MARPFHGLRSPPQGESISQLLTRALAELQTMARRHLSETVVVVTHGGFCYVLIDYILGSVNGDRREFAIGNASIHSLEVSGDRWAVISTNETAHLQGSEA